MEFLSEEDKNEIKNETFANAYEVVDEEEADIERDLEDWVEEGDESSIKSLFNDDRLESVDLLITHDRELFGFDLKVVVAQNCTDDLSVIKLINFIRSSVSGQPQDAINAEFVSDLVEKIGTREFIEKDEYMKPVIDDDALLYLYEEELLPNAQDTD